MKVRNIANRAVFTGRGKLWPGEEGETTSEIGKDMIELKLVEEIKPKRKPRSDKGVKKGKRARSNETIEQQLDGKSD